MPFSLLHIHWYLRHLIPFIGTMSEVGGESNESKVLRRLVAPRQDGSFLVPPEIVEKFKDIAGGGRAEVMRLFQDKCKGDKDPQPFIEIVCYLQQALPMCSGDQSYPSRLQDLFVKTCKKRVERITEDDLYVDGEFMSEQDMIEDNYKECLDCVDSQHHTQPPWWYSRPCLRYCMLDMRHHRTAPWFFWHTSYLGLESKPSRRSVRSERVGSGHLVYVRMDHNHSGSYLNFVCDGTMFVIIPYLKYCDNYTKKNMFSHQSIPWLWVSSHSHGLILRRDKYEKHVKVYWVETKTAGRKLLLGRTLVAVRLLLPPICGQEG